MSKGQPRGSTENFHVLPGIRQLMGIIQDHDAGTIRIHRRGYDAQSEWDVALTEVQAELALLQFRRHVASTVSLGLFLFSSSVIHWRGCKGGALVLQRAPIVL